MNLPRKTSLIFSILTFIALSTCGLVGSAFAYRTISAAEAYAMINQDPDVVVIDVRSNIDYCYYGHIPCARNLVWESDYTENYTSLPTGVPIINVCEHGVRGARASAFLDEQPGYDEVYNISNGMSVWPYEKITCAEENPGDCDHPNDSHRLYFPHIASGDGWETEIAVINLDREKSAAGSFQAFDENGNPVGERHELALNPAGRLELKVSRAFADAAGIHYIIVTSDSDQLYGYLKFFNLPDPVCRVAIPAVTRINQQAISIPHIASSDGWWTGLALLNTGETPRALTFTFNNGLQRRLELNAGAYKSIDLKDLIASPADAAAINSAVLNGAEGIIGLEIFGSGNRLGGVSLRDRVANTLYYPHIVNDRQWWTGIVAFNPGNATGNLSIWPYDADGNLLELHLRTVSRSAGDPGIEIAPGARMIGTADFLGLPAETAWLMVSADIPISGFELFGTTDGQQLAGYSCVNLAGNSGILAKLDDRGWTGVALVNTSGGPVDIVFKAYTDEGGEPVATAGKTLRGYERILETPEKIFTGGPENATYVRFDAGGPVVAFQLNGDGPMLDALPGR